MAPQGTGPGGVLTQGRLTQTAWGGRRAGTHCWPPAPFS